MIYELRTYHCLPGRLPALLQRFERDTLRFFEKYGIRQVGFWTVEIGESSTDLIYLLEWESLAERERIWPVFTQDPEWLAAAKASQVDGPITSSISNSILKPTKFSKLK